MVRGVGVTYTESGVSNNNATAKYGDVAYIPGSGPAEKFCDECALLVFSRGAKTYGRCLKAAELRRLDLTEIGYIARCTASCKYFILRAEGDKPWAWFKRDRGSVGDAGSGDGAEDS